MLRTFLSLTLLLAAPLWAAQAPVEDPIPARTEGQGPYARVVHVHLHSLADEQKVPSEYILKLWMAHGVTSVRELGSRRPIEWLVDIKQRSARNESVAPRIDIYPFFHEILGSLPNDVETARRAIARRRSAAPTASSS